MRKDTPEGRVKAEVMEYLSIRRVFAWVNNTGALKIGEDRFIKFGLKGSADIIGLLPGGRFLAVECKSPGGRLSDFQKDFLENVRGLGGLAVVAYSFVDVERALNKAGY